MTDWHPRIPTSGEVSLGAIRDMLGKTGEISMGDLYAPARTQLPAGPSQAGTIPSSGVFSGQLSSVNAEPANNDNCRMIESGQIDLDHFRGWSGMVRNHHETVGPGITETSHPPPTHSRNNAFAGDMNYNSSYGTVVAIGSPYSQQEDDNGISRSSAGMVAISVKTANHSSGWGGSPTTEDSCAWNTAAYITANTGTSSNYVASGADFGSAVAIVQDYLIVGAPGENSNDGVVYIYKRDTSSTNANKGWENVTLQARFTSPYSNAQYGYAVDINEDGDGVVIGAPYVGNIGYVYISTRSGTTWASHTLIYGSGSSGHYNGATVQIYGSGTSSRVYFSKNYGPGYVYVYGLNNGGAWTNTDAFYANGGVSGDGAAHNGAFAIDKHGGTKIALGVPYQDSTVDGYSANNNGEVQIWEATSSTADDWSHVVSITGCQDQANVGSPWLGYKVAMWDKMVVASAPRLYLYNTGATNSVTAFGAIYVWDGSFLATGADDNTDWESDSTHAEKCIGIVTGHDGVDATNQYFGYDWVAIGGAVSSGLSSDRMIAAGSMHHEHPVSSGNPNVGAAAVFEVHYQVND